MLCEGDNNTYYKVKLSGDAKNQSGGKDIVLTNYYPVTIERSKKKSDVYIVDCEGKEPYLLTGKEQEDFIRQNMIVVSSSDVDTIITDADSDLSPKINENPPEMGRYCNRFRQSIKIELRGMAGVRDFKKEGLPIPGYGEPDKDVLGFGVGGTNITVGAEVAVLPRIAKLGKKGSFNLGLLSGFWPVDGGLFIPLSIHPRFTLNEFTSPLWGRCNAYYLFGDVGAAYDASKNVPFLKDNNMPYSWFYGAGAGVDLWRSRSLDLSFDVGYRRTNMALPLSLEYVECINNYGDTQSNLDYPIRSIGQLFFRFGLTF